MIVFILFFRHAQIRGTCAQTQNGRKGAFVFLFRISKHSAGLENKNKKISRLAFAVVFVLRISKQRVSEKKEK
jgi:hypothetical protein